MEDHHHHQSFQVETIVKYSWTIKNVSELECMELYSDTFFTGPYPWRILITPKAANTGRGLSIYLEAVDTNGGTRYADYFNLHFQLLETCENKHTFGCSKNVKFGYKSLISSAEFLSSSNGFLVDDTCTVVAEVLVKKSIFDDYNHSSPKDVLVDFKGLCKIGKEFVQILEEVCSRHPNLVEIHRKRKMSEKFNEWLFTTLGKVLHFLKTKKVKDMLNDDACKELQYLWEELEMVKFDDDLSWLKKHVESALGVKKTVEWEMKVKRLKGSVDALEGEVKSFKEQMIVAERSLERARRELGKEKEGFVVSLVIDLDDDLACEIL
ncbi:hypothetical protein PIB30_020589 [Stylosanthes scabra]|uniref:MATH domain-containing protein n=1 Tax=Stylosanthes scabra TaxID=79078 RepID=A0ABU6Q8H2_9FABA|nr:hypothetical protein [Stylosanthes scabra]